MQLDLICKCHWTAECVYKIEMSFEGSLDFVNWLDFKGGVMHNYIMIVYKSIFSNLGLKLV